MSLIPTGKVCTDGVRWILNFRRTFPKIAREQIYRSNLYDLTSSSMVHQLCNHDNHSGGSLEWTIRQSKSIDHDGWDTWFAKNNGYLAPPKTTYQ